MLKLRIADIAIDIMHDNKMLSRHVADYLRDDGQADFTVELDDEYIGREIGEELKNNLEFPKEYSEYLAIYRYICTKFLDFDGFVMHGSAIAVNGRGYLFCAPSGTGKSTHSRMWREAFGDEVVMVNDDKPIIRKTDGVYRVCGTPWSGKHELDTNISVPLCGICVLKRATENSIVRVRAEDVLALLFNQIYRPTDTAEYMRTIDLVSDMIKSVPIFGLGCNMSHEAAVCAREALEKA